jgi:hypothetical protein
MKNEYYGFLDSNHISKKLSLFNRIENSWTSSENINVSNLNWCFQQ